MKFKNLILVLILAPVSIFAKTKNTPCYFTPFEFTEEKLGANVGSYEFGFSSNNIIDDSVYSKENELNKKRADFLIKYGYNKRIHKVYFSKDTDDKYKLTFNIVYYYKNKKGEESLVGLVEETYNVSGSCEYDNIKSKFSDDKIYNFQLITGVGGLTLKSSEYILFTDKRVVYDEQGNVMENKTLLTEVGVIAQDSSTMCGIAIFFKPALYGVITSLTYTKKKY
jgi:hypothetical protein